MSRHSPFAFLALILAPLVTPASAEWQRASSPHFIIYANETPDKLRAFAQKLERFDKGVRIARSMKDPPVGDGGRLTVLVVPGAFDVRMLHPATGGNMLGFYTPRYWGSVAVVPRQLALNSSTTPETVFFHEYAHHLMFSDFTTPVPAWLVEGFAEFMSTADINPDGSVGLGGGAVHRASTLRRPDRARVPLSILLGGERLRDANERAALYARGWLLAHYLTFDTARRGQIEAYLAAIAAGRSQIDAARTVFGDLAKLDQELDAYFRADKLPYLTIPAAQVKIGAVAVEPVGTGAKDYVPLMMKVQVGVEKGQRARLAADARRFAALYPGDPQMAMILASALLYNEDFVAGDAAADRAIALNPTSAEALILKARALAGRAKSGDKAVTFANARLRQPRQPARSGKSRAVGAILSQLRRGEDPADRQRHRRAPLCRRSGAARYGSPARQCAPLSRRWKAAACAQPAGAARFLSARRQDGGGSAGDDRPHRRRRTESGRSAGGAQIIMDRNDLSG